MLYNIVQLINSNARKIIQTAGIVLTTSYYSQARTTNALGKNIRKKSLPQKKAEHPAVDFTSNPLSLPNKKTVKSNIFGTCCKIDEDIYNIYSEKK